MSTLYLVATPIGNLEDITFRAVRILKEASVIFCEDTRTAKVLLSKYDIKTPTESFHAKSPLSKIEKIINLLKEGKNVAVISDAGTPAISDPGSLLVMKVREYFGDEVFISPIPGASALTSAVSASGLTGSHFTFYGFLPHKKGRETLFKEIAVSDKISVFYESPHRILKTLESLLQHAPLKKVVIARELTKIYEQVINGTAEELLKYFENNPDKVRGEFVVMVDSE